MGTIERALEKVQRGGRWTREPQRKRARKPAEKGNGSVSLPEGQASSNEQIVILDFAALRRANFLPHGEDQELLAEQCRAVKRPLVAHAFGRKATKVEDGNLIQVTSSLANEGKTFTCINLALSLAQEQDSTILLVDGDVANPELSKLFGLSGMPGLLDYLEDPQRTVESVVYRTSLPSLAIVPAGRPRADSGELVASDRMESFVDDTARAYPEQIVLLDSPPVLLSSVAAALATNAGQIVIVIRAGETKQDHVRDAVTSIDESKPVNLVLNQATRWAGFGGYGAYGNYGSYGTYGSSADKGKDITGIANTTRREGAS